MISFGAVQFNDPDGLIWVGVYWLVALVPISTIFDRLNPIWSLRYAMVLLIWLLFYIPDVIYWLGEGAPSIAESMKAESPFIELVREFFGLVICIGTLLFYYFKGRK